MPRLKSLPAHPPGSFQFLQPETGQATPFVGSFNFVVEQLQMLRKAHPFLCERHGWATENEVENYNAHRCISAGWLDFVQVDDPNAPVATYTVPPEKKKRLPVVGGIKRVSDEVASLVRWLGGGGERVVRGL